MTGRSESEDESPDLRATICAICGPSVPATLLYEANFAPSDLTPDVFSARRLPDRIHYQMVRCTRCGLVRSDPVLDSESLRRLYAESSFDYGTEVGGLRATYGRYLAKAQKLGGSEGSLLEVGAGNGFFLEEARRRGYKLVRGVEPSTSAVQDADPRIRPNLVCDVMRRGLFEDSEFDAVCLFQVFDHLPDPGAVLDACMQVLRPGGVLLCLNHNITAASALILKEHSPIVDIEHTYLYSPGTMKQIFHQHGYRVLEQGRVYNTLSLTYLTHLMPMPGQLRRLTNRMMEATGLGRLQVRAPLGNLYLIAQKPG